MAQLGLSTTHEGFVLDFLKFSRYKRTQCLKDMESAFTEMAESRLLEETFTSEEVREMLDGLCSVLKADIGSDLIHNSHTSALLLRQLFQQAEKWHLKLQVELSDLESGELLEKIAHFEQQELSTITGSLHKHKMLDPINSATAGGDKLLHMEIERLTNEKGKLQSRVCALEEKATNALSAKERLQEDLLIQQSSSTQMVSLDTSHLQQKIEQLQLELNQAKKNSAEEPNGESTLKRELESTSHNLLKVTAELEQTRKELEKKFSETAQYENMRKMMASKTATIQTLRSQLKKDSNGD